MPGEPYVIAGAGLCGAAAAVSLRVAGFDGPVVLVGEEPEPPYDRPALSKEVLQGTRRPDETFVHPHDWYAAQGIETRLGRRVSRIHPASRRVELEGGDSIPYERLLIATGGRPRLLAGVPPGERVLYLRTLDDARRLAERLVPGRRLLIVGGGFIGSEVAASARRLGVEVTLLEALDVPLSRALGFEIGEVIAQIHRDEGVDLRTGEAVVSVAETEGGVVVETTREHRLEAEAVVIGVGIVPNVEVVAGSGVEVDDGILVDERCRTALDGVFAAGDVARHHHPIFGRAVRVEHYDNARRQGEAAADNMLGRSRVFDDAHWFWSDQYDHNLQSVGVAHGWDQLVIRGSIAERRFTAFYLKDRRVQSVLALNRGRDIMRSRKLVHSQVPVDPDDLRDESVDLRRLTDRR